MGEEDCAMANPEHVALVRQGWQAIAEWRQAHPDALLDLRGAELAMTDLRSADLRVANLAGANLNMANLSNANLGLANMCGANLCEAFLCDADMEGANLNDANLSRAWPLDANLTNADLTGANLRDAILVGARMQSSNLSRATVTGADLRLALIYFADLDGTDLSLAQTGFSLFVQVDLSNAVGLATVRHTNLSHVDVGTLVASVRGAGGRLTPELMTFFRGAGVPEELLKEVPRIVAEVKYYTCFISYGQPDVEFAKKLTEDLRAKGVSCWLWETDKTVGQRTQHEIEEKLEEYEKIVVLCSIHSLLGNGIRREIDRQLAKDPDKLVPVSLEEGWRHDNYKVDCLGTDLKPFLIDRNYADFANKPYEEALAELLKGLRRP